MSMTQANRTLILIANSSDSANQKPATAFATGSTCVYWKILEYCYMPIMQICLSWQASTEFLATCQVHWNYVLAVLIDQYRHGLLYKKYVVNSVVGQQS